MNFKRKNNIIRLFIGIFTLLIIFGTAFVDIYPIAAASHSTPTESSQPSTSKKEEHNTTYRYDEDFNWNRYWENSKDNGWNSDWNQDWDRDSDYDNQENEDRGINDKALAKSYTTHGIEKKEHYIITMTN